MSKARYFPCFYWCSLFSSLLLANEITVKHSLGEAVVKKNPERVIVFDYGTLDTLERMGIDIIGLPKSNLLLFSPNIMMKNMKM